MKRKRIILICAVFAACCLSACAGLSGNIDKKTLKEKSAGVISLLEAADYKAVYAMLRSDVAAEVSAQQLEETFSPLLGSLGARKSFKRGRFSIKTDKASGEEYCFCRFTVLYADGTATYAVAYDMDHTLIGLSVAVR